MEIAYLIGKTTGKQYDEMNALVDELSASGFSLYRVSDASDFHPGTSMLLSMGGDGTFLKASRIAAASAVPVLGVNFGRLGFLSEFRPEDVPAVLGKGDFSIEQRALLQVGVTGVEQAGSWPYVFNEVAVRRCSGGTLGIDAYVDGCPLPTYWADGLLVSTSAGSTAYSLSAGGPICMPDVNAMILVPVAPHNINVRALLLPDKSTVRLRLHCRQSSAVLELDNRAITIDGGAEVTVSRSDMSLKVVSRGRQAFIDALQDKLYWGEDRRNNQRVNDNE